MRYIIEPLNERQEMNCHVKFAGKKSGVIDKAINIASALQGHLTGNDITCRIRKAARHGSFLIADESGQSIIVTPDGRVLDEATGNSI